MAHPISASPRTRPCATRTDASQPPPAAGRAAQPWPPSLRSQGVAAPDAEDLLAAVAAGSGDRVLFIGEAGGELLCDALHRGCRGGAAFRAAPAHPDPVEIVVAPAIRTEEAGRAVADCARRALPAGGRLALRLIGDGAASLARSIAARLRVYGFERVGRRGQEDAGLLVYRLPAARRAG
ncbi:hypothetical protein [Roseomonas sp. WA12]